MPLIMWLKMKNVLLLWLPLSVTFVRPIKIVDNLMYLDHEGCCQWLNAKRINSILDQGVFCVSPNGVGSTSLRQTPTLRLCRVGQHQPGQIHWNQSTHSGHVFLVYPRLLGPGCGRSVTDLILDEAHCTCPYHLISPLRGTDNISLMPYFLICGVAGPCTLCHAP